MEVLGSHLKDSDSNRRLPRDTKGESDISLLVACKVQLSSEVIRWKSETLRLQKERDSAQTQSRELDQRIAKLGERTRELEERLTQAEDENRHLKSTRFALEKERALQRLHYNANKCSSLESSIKCEGLQGLESRRIELSPPLEGLEPRRIEEDWRQVSQKMLEQMKNEMRELKELKIHHQAAEKENAPDISGDADCEEVKIELSNLLFEAQSMKKQFLEQRQKLESILETVISGDFRNQDETFLNHSRQDADSLSADVQSSNPRRMSAEDYRLHFSKQLENTSDAKKMARKVQHFLKSPDLCLLQTVATEELQSPDYRADGVEEALEVRTEDCEKVCPICQITFRASVSQADFEEHVVNHLERESASLLDQYVIV